MFSDRFWADIAWVTAPDHDNCHPNCDCQPLLFDQSDSEIATAARERTGESRWLQAANSAGPTMPLALSKRSGDACFPRGIRRSPRTDRPAFRPPVPMVWRTAIHVASPRVARVEGDDLPASDGDTTRLVFCHQASCAAGAHCTNRR